MTDHKVAPRHLALGRTTGGVNTPVQVDASGVVQVSSGGGGGAATIADGADVTQGALADAAVGDSSATQNSHLRYIAKALADVWSSGFHWFSVSVANATLAVTQSGSWVIAAGTALIGSVKVAGYQNASWAVHHLPSANVQATITQASAGGSIKNVCTGFSVTLAAGATAPTAIQVSVALIDGASGGTNYLWRSVISLPATAGATAAFVFGRRWDVGTAATAMTLEFSIAGGANTIESVSMSGTTTL